MLKHILSLFVVAVLLIGTSQVHAQKATEIYIPCGKSPGLSGTLTILGNIETIDAQNNSLTISDSSGSYTVKVNDNTKIWLDKSLLKKTNSVGQFSDCKKGDMIEVKYTESQRQQTVTAEWIKVQIKNGS